MTKDFHNSLWTDQEVGVAFGRGVPIVSVKLGKVPMASSASFQALSCSWDTAAKEIVKLMVKHEKMLNAYIEAVEKCGSFDKGNLLSEILPNIDKLNKQQAIKLVSAFNNNGQVRSSFGFNGEKPRYYGDGLVPHLNRLTGRKYKISRSGKIENE